jgi:polyisoprenoid-binding protein YceI
MATVVFCSTTQNMKNSLFLAILLFSFIGVFAQKTLVPTDEGSKIHFVIKNFGINTGGDLGGLKGTIKFDAQHPQVSNIDVTVQVNTIDTDNERRDKHLKNDDFFDAEKYPVIRISSTKIEGTTTASTYMFTGKLTIKDVTKEIRFPFTAVPSGNGYLFEGEFSINRLEYHVGGESATISDDVKVSLKAFAR